MPAVGVRGAACGQGRLVISSAVLVPSLCTVAYLSYSLIAPPPPPKPPPETSTPRQMLVGTR